MKQHLFIDSNGKARRQLGLTFEEALALAMSMPMRTTLDYCGIARKCLFIEPLPQGALPTYDRDIDTAAIAYNDAHEQEVCCFKHNKLIINSNGKAGKRFGSRVMMPTFEVVSNPTIRITDVKQRRFKLIERTTKPTFKHDKLVIDSNGKAAHNKMSRIFSQVIQKAKFDIMAQEDAEIFKALDNATIKDK